MKWLVGVLAVLTVLTVLLGGNAARGQSQLTLQIKTIPVAYVSDGLSVERGRPARAWRPMSPPNMAAMWRR